MIKYIFLAAIVCGILSTPLMQAQAFSDTISFASQQALDQVLNDVSTKQQKDIRLSQNDVAAPKKTKPADQAESDALDELDDILGGDTKSKTRKVKKLLGDRSTVNGVQGRWLPQKVWEQDVDNNAAANALRKTDDRNLSNDALGLNRAPSSAWNAD